MPVNVQIAFQGGGARLVLFFGVIKALQRLEAEGVIKVTRVSGASAGAIAATLFAGKANIDALVQYHRSLRNNGGIFAAFPDISDPNLLQKLFSIGKVVATSQPLGDEKKFAGIIKESLKVAGVEASTVGELSIPCLVNCTDVVEHKTVKASKRQSIVQALVDSAALPFLFRIGGQRLDGGILDNLPVELLGTPLDIKPKYGAPVGISFSPDRHTAPVAKPTDLAKRLLETVINERVARSKELLGPNHFLELDTVYDGIELSTFSVENYFDVLDRDTVLDLVESKTMDWFRSFAAREESASTVTAPTTAFNKNQIDMEAELKDFAHKAHTSLDCDLLSTTFDVTARCLEGMEGVYDEVSFIDVFRVRDKPIHAYVSRLSLANDALPTEAEVKVFNGDGVFINSSQFLIPDLISKVCWVLVLFHNPIEPSEGGTVYSVHLKQLEKDVMGPLRDNGSDYLSVIVNQAEVAEEAKICLHTPKDCEIALMKGEHDLIEKLRIYCPKELGGELEIVGKEEKPGVNQVQRCPAGYKTHVWATKKLKKTQELRVVVTTRK